ncbi:hypothetical protein ES703_117455 [subsurface metagenome]
MKLIKSEQELHEMYKSERFFLIGARSKFHKDFQILFDAPGTIGLYLGDDGYEAVIKIKECVK